jgi:monoamine oxidase
MKEGLSGYGYTDHEFLSVFHSTANQPGPSGIVEAYVSGKLSHEIASIPEEQRIQRGLDWMEQLYPSIRRYTGNTASICWDNDPWAGGAYSWFKPGEMTSLLPLLQTPTGRIHFAGDHTSSLPGWMQGALESAHRVVKEINAKSQ